MPSNCLLPIILSALGFAALFAAIWILHRPLDVHSCTSRAVRNTHRALEWALTLWGVVLLLQVARPFLLPRHDTPAPAMNDASLENAIFRIAEIEVKPEFLDAYLAAAADVGATSVSQISVSTASTWQKNGRMPGKLAASRQWRRRRAVSAVTFHLSGASFRHASTSTRMELMKSFVP